MEKRDPDNGNGSMGVDWDCPLVEEGYSAVGCGQAGAGHDESRGSVLVILLAGPGGESRGIGSTTTMVPSWQPGHLVRSTPVSCSINSLVSVHSSTGKITYPAVGPSGYS